MKTQLVILSLAFILAVLCWLVLCDQVTFAQQQPQQQVQIPPEEHQRVKDLLIKEISITDYLEKQNAEMNNLLTQSRQLINEILKVKSLEELDEILNKYGLNREKAEDGGLEANNKAGNNLEPEL